MTNWPILSLMVFIPLFGAFIISLIDGEEKNIVKNSKMVALWTSMVVFILSIFLWATFPTDPGFHFIEEVNIFSSVLQNQKPLSLEQPSKLRKLKILVH